VLNKREMGVVVSGMKIEDAMEILTIGQLAAFLRVHPSTVYRLIKNHQIPAFRLGKHGDWRFSLELINQWLGRQHERAPMGRTIHRNLKLVV
jgi:excisionase family DNA binding protein